MEPDRDDILAGKKGVREVRITNWRTTQKQPPKAVTFPTTWFDWAKE